MFSLLVEACTKLVRQLKVSAVLWRIGKWQLKTDLVPFLVSMQLVSHCAQGIISVVTVEDFVILEKRRTS